MPANIEAPAPAIQNTDHIVFFVTRGAPGELVDPDPTSELELLEELLAEAPLNIHKSRTSLGADFASTQRILGYRWSLGRPPADIVAALESIVEFGVALFERGRVGSDVIVTLSLRGEKVQVPGGITDQHGAPRWIAAASAAIVVRDKAALDSLCRFNPASFEGNYDDHFDLYAEALMAVQRQDSAVGGLLEQAHRAAEAAKIAPELGRRVAAPCIRTAQAVLAGDTLAYNERLAEGLTAYRTVYQRPDFSHEAANLLPLRYLALSALAHDRGLACRVKSDYIPAWVVEGTALTDGAPMSDA